MELGNPDSKVELLTAIEIPIIVTGRTHFLGRRTVLHWVPVNIGRKREFTATLRNLHIRIGFGKSFDTKRTPFQE